MYVAMKRHSDNNEDKQPDKRPRSHQVTSHTSLHAPTKFTIPRTPGNAGPSRLGGVALRTGASAFELPPWPSHPEPAGCEPHGTMAVCLPARAGHVLVCGAKRCEVRIVTSEVADPGPVGLQ